MDDFSVKSVYCPNLECDNLSFEIAQLETFCEDCGWDLVPAPTCECGREINPRSPYRKNFCGNCRQPWTSEYLMERVALRLARWEQIKGATHGN